MNRILVENLTDEQIAEMVRDLVLEEVPANRKRKSEPLYNTVCAFDIETTNFPDEEFAICYLWAFQFGLDNVIIGRTIEAAADFFRRLSIHLNYTLVVYVHNLSFEFQFLKGVYDFQTEDIFATDLRKILRCYLFNKKIEMRCSYFLSNMSLAKFCFAEGSEHQKLSGEDFDYSKIRYPWTDLTEKELLYQIHDVLGLVEAVYNLMQRFNDNLYTIPLTNTGYVRRDARKALQKKRMEIISLLPDEGLYIMLRRAFRGGNTHASRFRAGKIEKNVHNIDEASAYPYAETLKFPVKPFYQVKNPSYDRFIELVYKREKAVLIKISVWGLTLKDDIPIPYISRSKAWNLSGECSLDNGRILTCDYCELYFTDIDFRIFIDQYEFDDIRIDDLYYSSYGDLPEELLNVTMEYFKTKTDLKGVDDYFYMKSKNRLNSVYGMCAQDPCKDDIIFSNSNNTLDFCTVSIREALEKYAKNPLMPYQWGVWITAHARYRLQELINMVPFDRVCYVDTDSVKYAGEPVDFSSYNDKRIAEAEAGKFYALDRSGKKHYLGLAEQEPDYKRFKTLGAKKYVYEDLSGDLHITIAGVNKKLGAEELKKRGGIAAFKEGFTFYKGGGTESVYNDNVDAKLNVDGHELRVTDNVCIKSSTYTLGLTEEYRLLIKNNFQDLVKKELIKV